MIKKEFQLPDGRISDYDIKDEGKAACIFALTPEKMVVLAKQFRPGIEKILLEMPGGMVDEGEDELVGGNRELMEETGYAGDICTRVAECYDCAYSNMVRTVLVVENCKKVQEPTPEEDEFIEIVEVTIEEFRALLRSGKMTDVECGYLALDYLGLL